MCGPETTDRPRGGALAALAPPPTLTTMTTMTTATAGGCDIIRGDLAFHTPGFPGSTQATHARLTPAEACDLNRLAHLHIVIHSSGDLTRSAEDCGLFRQIAFPTTANPSSEAFVELPLDQPLSLEVGNEGIIGRRVSLYSRSSPGRDLVVAEGIVGFNFVNPARSSL